MKLHSNDQVVIRTGKDRGKKGKILKVFPKTNRLVVEGVNIVKKHAKPTPKRPHGGIISMEAPIHASNATLICPSCSKPTKVGKQVTKTGTVRICRACQAALTTAKK